MIPIPNELDKFFRIISYGVALSALFTLFASGSVGIIAALFFLAIVILAWNLENSRWQISEKLGVVIIVLLVPLFFLDWKFNYSGFSSRDSFNAGNLSRLILVLSSVKLLQKKSDRDWVFIYLISFFEILLAAGIGVSPLFIAGLLLYLLLSFISIILFEIRKSSNSVSEKKEKVKPTQSLSKFRQTQLFRLPITAFIILIIISVMAVPLFFAFPRVGGANIGGSLSGLSGFTGFSDSVRLGEIGKLQQNDQVVMRVNLEKKEDVRIRYFRWRGVALDSFDNQIWRRSKIQQLDPILKNERDFFPLDTTKDVSRLIAQTIYLEPIDTPVIFSLSRPVALQGNFSSVTKDLEGSLSVSRTNWGRISYKVFSDPDLPGEEILREDNSAYPKSMGRYLQLPEKLDERIIQLTQQIIADSGAKNRFEQAKAVEDYLQNSYGYTLDLKAGGKEPLSDFLFNVREGHCEYFASALAIMLRTQGIATRLVNGFQSGEYNETAGVYVVRQKDAHSWVEVYFPQEKVWIPFDATPAAGQFSSEGANSFGAKINQLVEALETFWIQYVVNFDNQEQSSLFRKIRNGLVALQLNLSIWLSSAQESLLEWWQDVRGDKGFVGSLRALGIGVIYIALSFLGVFLFVWLGRKIRKLETWKRFILLFQRRKETTAVEFYQRMQKVLGKRGLRREPDQTPLEFAFALDMPEAVKITEKYNGVRFGEKNLSKDEAQEIEDWLKNLEGKNSK
jgi:protein-glutamine gamma-glutamyltransferase